MSESNDHQTDGMAEDLTPSSIRSYGSDDGSLSGQSMRSVDTDTTSSIITALLGSTRIESTTASGETTDIMVVSDLELAGLARVLTSGERRDGIPPKYSSGNSLVRRMKELFTFPLHKAPDWLWRPLFEGLMKGGALLDVMVGPPSGAQLMPILAWLCQWRSLQKLWCWKGDNDVVSMVLAAGANPNVVMNNGICTSLFFAVKNSSLETIKLLVKYGADLTIKDNKGRSCLWNALERPDPEIVDYLLETLAADEAFPYHVNNRRRPSFQTAVDYLFAAQLTLSFDGASNPEYPVSWQVLGEPSAESVALTMIEFGKRGTTFTSDNITLTLLRFVLRGDDPNPKYNEAKLRLERLAKLVVGRWLPDSVRQEIQNSNEQQHEQGDESNSQVCHICNVDRSQTDRPRLKLYCGHDFCLTCVLDHGDGTNLDLTCPVCRKMMCLDLTRSASRRWEVLTEAYGDYGAAHGPKVLTSMQLRMECRTRGITTLLRNDKTLRTLLLNDSVLSSSDRNSKPIPQFDLNTSVPITNGIDTTLMAPKGGPIVIPIVVKGVPVTAFISTTSYFTLLSPEFVELFGLCKVGLDSDNFKNVLGRESVEGTQSLVDEFRFQLGEIDICLRNTLQTSLPTCMGVQLGVDFLRSGAWCVIDAQLNGNIEQLRRSGSYISTDGFGNTSYTSPNRKEELRYYAHDGTTFRTPLLHLQPFKVHRMSNWASVANCEYFAECSWCCRIFLPTGMLRCQQRSEVYYCTETCRDAAFEVHKAQHEDN